VLPLSAVAGNEDAAYLGEGIAETLTNMLSRLKRLRVAPSSSAFRHKDTPDPASAGRVLGVAAVLTGRIALRSDWLRLQAELVETATASQVWGHRYARQFADILALEEDIAKEIFEALRLQLTAEERARLARRHTEDIEAYQLYLRGRYSWKRRGIDTLRNAIGFFQQSIARDPSYALAYSGLADSWAILGSFGYAPPVTIFSQAKAAAEKAIEIDPELAEPYASRGYCRSVYDWDWEGAAADFRRSIERNEEYDVAHHWYSVSLCARGRFEEAIAEFRRAEQLDPLSPIISATGAMTMLMGRRYHEALEQIQKCLRQDPDFGIGLLYRSWILLQVDQAAEAVASIEKSAGGSRPGAIQLGYLVYALARAGRPEEARHRLQELQDLARRRYATPYAFAVACIGLDDRPGAMQALEKGFQERAALLHWVAQDPVFDPLRGDPRFQEMLARMGLSA
jgi:TolB-like protein/Tfp pilus assembly protein PilF